MIGTKGLVKKVAKDTGMSKREVEEIIASVIHSIEGFIVEGEEVALKGFGRFAGQIKPPEPVLCHFGKKKDTLSRGRIAIRFHHFDSNKQSLWNNSVFPKVYEENGNG